MGLFVATIIVLSPMVASGTVWSWDGDNGLLIQEVGARVQEWNFRKDARFSAGVKKSSEITEVNEDLRVGDRKVATAPQLILNPNVGREGKASRADRPLGNTRADRGNTLEFEFDPVLSEDLPPDLFEGESAVSIQVRLSEAPTEALTVTLLPKTSNNYSLTVTPATLTFTTDDWGTYQSFDVGVTDDEVTQLSQDCNYVGLTAKGSSNNTVISAEYPLVLYDNDPLLAFDKDIFSLSDLNGGEQLTIQIKMHKQPTGEVSVDLAAYDQQYLPAEYLSINPSSLTFCTADAGGTNSWADYQTITVSYSEDETQDYDSEFSEYAHAIEIMVHDDEGDLIWNPPPIDLIQ